MTKLDDNKIREREYAKKWYRQNRESIVTKRRERYWAKRDELKEANRLRYYKHREKRLAYMATVRKTPNYIARIRLAHAVRAGKLVKQPCEACGETRSFGHHHKGYEQKHWFDVQWLCNKHHGEVHRVNA